jgi:hypothetical protein
MDNAATSTEESWIISHHCTLCKHGKPYCRVYIMIIGYRWLSLYHVHRQNEQNTSSSGLDLTNLFVLPRRRIWHKRLSGSRPGGHTAFSGHSDDVRQNVKISIWLLVHLINECLLLICGKKVIQAKQCHRIFQPKHTWTTSKYLASLAVVFVLVAVKSAALNRLTEVKPSES